MRYSSVMAKFMRICLLVHPFGTSLALSSLNTAGANVLASMIRYNIRVKFAGQPLEDAGDVLRDSPVSVIPDTQPFGSLFFQGIRTPCI